MIKKYFFLMAGLLIWSNASAQTYPKNLFAVAQMRIDSVRQPHGWNWYLQSREASVVLSSVAAYMGVNPSYVKLALETVPRERSDGEESFYDLPVPSGYAFCAARIGVRSIVPADGDRASVISANATRDGVAVYTWTPVRHSLEGRSWVEADVQVTGIKPQFLSEFRDKGVCKGPANDILACRGNPCAGVEHGRIQDAGPTTGDLTKGF